MSEGPSSPKRLRVDDDYDKMSKEEVMEILRQRDRYIKVLDSKGRGKGNDTDGRESEEKSKQEASRRENTLVHRLTIKEHELQDYMNQLQEIKQAQTPSSVQLRSMLLDPAINLAYQRMVKEMEECKEKLKQTQNELSAWKFTRDSQTGKRLMAKCQMLFQENEEIGKMIVSGRTAKLEGEISLQKTLVQEMKKNQEELDDFLAEIDEDVEGMQSMIIVLQQRLKESKEEVSQLQQENKMLREQQRTSLAAAPCSPSIHRDSSSTGILSNSNLSPERTEQIEMNNNQLLIRNGPEDDQHHQETPECGNTPEPMEEAVGDITTTSDSISEAERTKSKLDHSNSRPFDTAESNVDFEQSSTSTECWSPKEFDNSNVAEEVREEEHLSLNKSSSYAEEIKVNGIKQEPLDTYSIKRELVEMDQGV